MLLAGNSNIITGITEMKRPELDRFGGWTGKRFKATGFFRLEKDERWWLVTPEGNAFLSFGINHFLICGSKTTTTRHGRSGWG